MEKKAKLLKDYEGRIESDVCMPREQWFTLQAAAPGISARRLAAEYGMEELAAYKNRSRDAIDKIRGSKFAD
jgi:hypothetical protein